MRITTVPKTMERSANNAAGCLSDAQDCSRTRGSARGASTAPAKDVEAASVESSSIFFRDVVARRAGERRAVEDLQPTAFPPERLQCRASLDRLVRVERPH